MMACIVPFVRVCRFRQVAALSGECAACRKRLGPWMEGGW